MLQNSIFMLLDDKSQMVNQQDMIIFANRSVFGHRWLWNSSKILAGIPLKKPQVICNANKNL